MNATENRTYLTEGSPTSFTDEYDQTTQYHYYYDSSYYYDDDEPYFLKMFPFEVIALGYVRPILVLLTAVANFFVLLFFLTKRNRRNGTHLLFISIAFSDTMTGLLLLPNSFYVYMQGNDLLTRDWCERYMVLKLYFSRVFHTVSVWQTLILGFQRYTCVCHPFISGRLCTIWKTFVSIIAAYCLAFLLHAFHVLDNRLIESPPICAWEIEVPCIGMCIYLWFYVVLQNLAPCIMLIWFTYKTIKGLRKANRRMSSMSKSQTSKRSSRERTISMTSTLVVCVFLIPELPHGFYSVILALSAQDRYTFGQLSTLTNHVILCVYELTLIISFHANFWIYCSMMKDFREVMVSWFCCRAFLNRQSRVRSMSDSISTRKDSTRSTFLGSFAGKKRVLSTTTSIYSNSSDACLGNLALTTAHGEISVESKEPKKPDEDTPNDDVFV